MKSSWFSRAAFCTFSNASRIDALIRLKFSERSAISAVPRDLDAGAVLAVGHGARRLGQLRDRPGQPPREEEAEHQGAGQARRAPEDRVANHPVDRGEGDVAVALDEDSPGRVADRERSRPGRRRPACSPSGSDAPGSGRSRPRASRGGAEPGLRWRAGRGSAPAGRRAWSGPRAAPRPGTRGRWVPRTPAPRRPRCARPSRPEPGPRGRRRRRARRRRRDRPRSGRRPARTRSPSGTRGRSPGLRMSGPTKLPCPSRLTARSAARGFWPRRTPPRISGRIARGEGVPPGQLERQPKGVGRRRQLLPGGRVVGGDVVGDRGRGPGQVLLLERLEGAPVPADEDRLGHEQRDQGREDQTRRRAGRKDGSDADPSVPSR